MYDENQNVSVKWINQNRDWYESKGYEFNGWFCAFDVKAKDLMPHSSAKINVKCDYCGREYTTQYALITKGRNILPKDACCHCASKKSNEVSLQKRANKYLGIAENVCKEKGYILLTTKNEYTDVKMPVTFICPKHGEQTMSLEVLNRGCGCLACAIEYRARKISLKEDDVKEYIESVNDNKLLNPHEYVNNHTCNLMIKCSCGNIYNTSFASYRDGAIKCPSCSQKMSKGEECIKNFLDDNKVDFIQEKRFDDCCDIKPLPFDFYLPNKNLIIEFDGQHHFYETGRGNYETTKKHDVIKNQYCKDNNIDLLRIPYWEGNNIEDIITTKLNL